jgi:UPF0716 protein FxsA
VSTLARLFLIFTLVPLIELWLLVRIGGQVGALPTIAMVAGAGMLGAWMVRREGRKALSAYQKAMTEGRLPEDGIVSGLLILVGGILLITPGVLTDVAGIALMIPPLRRAVARRLEQRMQTKIEQGVASGNVRVIGFGGGNPFAGDDPFASRGSMGSVIDVEAHEQPSPPPERS